MTDKICKAKEGGGIEGTDKPVVDEVLSKKVAECGKVCQEEEKEETGPMGVDEWLAHGKKYGYWQYFTKS